MTNEPKLAGHFQVSGIRLYHEVHGEGPPVVLLPGGLMTIPEMSGLLEALRATHQVIAVELQGHGRTPDAARPLRFETMADDIAALITHLGHERADLVGYSLGGAVALRVAVQHPARVRRMALLSTAFAAEGWFPEARAGQRAVSAAMAPQLLQTPTGRASRDWPTPDRFPGFLDKLGALVGGDYDWTADVRRIAAPTMLLYADHDAIATEHMAAFFNLLGGGLKDAGWQNPRLSRARLAIVPGYTHYNFGTAPELGPILRYFLDDSLSAPRGSAAAEASRA